MLRARLLIVEDERITAEDLCDILTGLGYEVVSIVSSGAAAIAEVERAMPDLVLMDIRIQGDLDGTETARILRDRFQTQVVFLTAHSDAETLSRAKAAEPLGYIVKPFQESELHATVEMALHKNRAERERRAEHDRLVAAVESIGEGVICTNAVGAVMFMNPASEAWTGWARADALGKGLGEVIKLRKRDGAEIEVPAGGVLDDGLLRELQDDVQLAAKNDHARPIGGTVAPIRDHAGRVTGVALVFGRAQSRAVPWQEDSATNLPQAGTKQSAVIAKSESMRQLLNFAYRVAASEASSILIEGESGVGKDVVARLIHENSRRSAKAFLALNCAAIPETLLESELFGYEKGAFTDAKSQKRGILELATGGTAFLDEIGELPISLQAKLLRVLEEHIFRRLGGTKDIEVDLRVIAATNRQLRIAIEEGRFRVDLYYRLNVIQLSIPPLRERPDDILPLARHFVDLYSRKFGRAIEGLASDAVSTLLAHDWPGNVRELRNSIERAMLIADGGLIQASALGIRKEAPFVLAAEAGSDGNPSLAHFERNLVLQALEKTSWNQTKASQLLKISRDALRYKMKKFNLKPPQSYAQ
jgi:DNA-binding NtrC family response regulator